MALAHLVMAEHAHRAAAKVEAVGRDAVGCPHYKTLCRKGPHEDSRGPFPEGVSVVADEVSSLP